MRLALTLPGNYTITPPQDITTLLSKTTNYGGNIFAVGIGLLFIIATLLALTFLVWGGVKWIISEGDPKNIAGAKTTMVYALVGLITIFSAYFLINLLASFFQIPFVGK